MNYIPEEAPEWLLDEARGFGNKFNTAPIG